MSPFWIVIAVIGGMVIGAGIALLAVGIAYHNAWGNR